MPTAIALLQPNGPSYHTSAQQFRTCAYWSQGLTAQRDLGLRSRSASSRAMGPNGLKWLFLGYARARISVELSLLVAGHISPRELPG
jgi:hypothetical protein